MKDPYADDPKQAPVQYGCEYCKLDDFKDLVLGPYRGIVEHELDWWHQWYLPLNPEVLNGKMSQFDFGAGAGETAKFYLLHGAKHVVAVEGDPEALKLLRYNFRGDPRIMIVPYFIGGWKMDVEGAEWGGRFECHGYKPRMKKLYAYGGSQTIYMMVPGPPSPGRTKKFLVWQGAKRRRLIGF